MAERKPYRLPTSVLPNRYEIRLIRDPGAATFSGQETISVDVREPVEQIIVNAAELELLSVSVKKAGGATISGTVALDPENEQATLSFPQMLTPGPWEVQIGFSGILNDKLHGFYRSTYKNSSGEEKVLASTQFESTDARRAFPCWDEPAFKAVFATTLAVDPALQAISNTAVIEER